MSNRVGWLLDAHGGSSGPSPTAPSTGSVSSTTTDTDGPSPAHPAGDPDEDVLGWENGLWYDESIAVDESDGLNYTERDLVVSRAMARVEVIRGLEFNGSVNVVFQTRSTFTLSPPEGAWWNQYWEMLFMVGESQLTADAYATLYDTVIDGLTTEKTIVILVEDRTSPTINRNTLAHELVHVVETQHRVHPDRGDLNQDATTAERSLIEGSAIFYEQRYAERCRTDWSCLDLPTREESDVAPAMNQGLYVAFATRYSAGRRFVESLHERGGETALANARESPPESTEQVIHPDRYPGDQPVSVTIPDRSSDQWQRLSAPGRVEPTGTVGEARLYTMFWYNAVPPNGTVEVTRSQQVDLSYTHPTTTGWAGDAFVPYVNGSQYGYVLKTVWETEADAREFQVAYVRLLQSRNATVERKGTYRIPGSDPYADAFRVNRRGATVIVVNAPTVDQLDDIHRLE